MKRPLPHLIRHSLARAGFSLIETLMATGIISTAALGTLGLLASTMSMSMDGSQRSKAIVIAQELFHDLQLGALDVTPAATDERQTNGLRPETGLGFARHVLFYDRAGIPLVSGQPGEGAHQSVYEQGTTLPGVEWLVSVEGIQSADYTSNAGAGQVMAMPDPTTVAPLSPISTESGAYPFPVVISPPDPTLTPPTTALTQVRISIESPPTAPAKRRKKFSYDFYWNR